MKSVVLRRATILLASLCISITVSTTWAQSGTPANIPDSFKGAYLLVMANASSSSPIANGTQINIIIGNSNTLCSPGLVLTNPVVRGLDTYWDNNTANLSFRLLVSQQGTTQTFAGLELSSSSGDVFGVLEMQTPLVATSQCGASETETSNADSLFAAVEAAHSDLFPANPFSTNQTGDGYDVYRFYQSTGIYLAILDGLVYARGGDFGGQFVFVGTVDELLNDPQDLARPYFANYSGNFALPGFGGFNTDDLEFIQGTYRLTMTDAAPYSLIPEGTELIFVITPQGQMCVGETVLGFPTMIPVIDGEGEITTSASWRNIFGNLSYDIYLNRNDTLEATSQNMTLGSVNMRTAFGNPYYGRFDGEKISLATECSDASGGNPDLPDINTMFALAEAQYPELFPSGPQTYNQYNDGFVYRYYFGTGTFTGVKNGQVFLNGGQFGNSPNPVAVGTLTEVLDQLNNTPVPSVIPASQAGTYAMTFTGATSVSPFADGTAVTVVLDADGGMCFDGVPLADAISRPSAPDLAIWESANAGLSMSLDLSNLSDTALTLSVASLNGTTYASLEGTKTSLSVSCGSSGTNVTQANQLFALAEQYYSALFPASVLSGTQISGQTVSRFYPATGTSIIVTDSDVSVRGGPFGSSTQRVGNINSIIDQIVADSTNPSGAPVHDLQVTGTRQTRVGNLATINSNFRERAYGVVRPDGADTAAMRELVIEMLENEVPNFTSITVSVLADTASYLTFSANVRSTSEVANSTTTRTYSLIFSIEERK